MLRFEGDRDFSQPPAELLVHLADARFLVQCIPDVESVSNLEADKAQVVLRPGFSFVRGTLEADLQILQAVLPTIRILLRSKGIGSSSEVEATLDLNEQEGGTRVHWITEVKSLGGLLKLVPAGLIRGAAEKVITDAWSRICEKLTAKA